MEDADYKIQSHFKIFCYNNSLYVELMWLIERLCCNLLIINILWWTDFTISFMLWTPSHRSKIEMKQISTKYSHWNINEILIYYFKNTSFINACISNHYFNFFPHCIKNIMNFPNWLKDPEISFVKRQLRGTKRSKHSQLSEISHAGWVRVSSNWTQHLHPSPAKTGALHSQTLWSSTEIPLFPPRSYLKAQGQSVKITPLTETASCVSTGVVAFADEI